ncbi:MAG: triple tyrosine motif-containing protein, partial [Bacteroidota bacterium]
MIKKIDQIRINPYWLTMIVFVVSPLLFYAQMQRLPIHHLTIDDGLSQSSNDFIYRDSFGFVWLSSLDGLNRFDGKTIKVYKSILGDSTSLLGNIITSNFFEDKNSNLWFTTYEGLHCYIRKEDHFLRFQLNNEHQQTQKQDYHAFHLDAQGQLWLRVGILSTGELHVFDTKQYSDSILCAIDGQRNRAIEDENGIVKQVISYRFDQGNGIEILDLEPTFSRWGYFDGIQKAFPEKRVECIDFSSEEQWYLGVNNGLLRFSYEDEKFDSISYFDDKAIGQVYDIEFFNDSILLVSSGEQGILLYNKILDQFVGKIPNELERKLGLHLKLIKTIHRDESNNLWMSSVTSGVNYTSLNKQKFTLPDEFFGRNVFTVFESSRGEIFISLKIDSVNYFSISSDKLESVPIAIPNRINEKNPIEYFFEDAKGEVWGVYLNTLLKWDFKKKRFEYIQKLPSYTLSIYPSRTKGVLISTYKGVFQVNTSTSDANFTPFELTKELQSSLSTAIYEDAKGRFYFAVDASKLVVLGANGKKIKQIEDTGYVKDFYEEGRFLWIATTKRGVLKINISDLTIEILNEQNGGLPNETYYSIIPDEQNNFWLSSNKGIVRYNRNTKTYHRYTLADGLQGNEYNTNAFLKTQDGEIWMGGTNGLNRFYPENIKSEIPLAKVQFTRLQINDEAAPDSINITMTEELSLAYSDNTLSFDFVGIDYSDPENVQLKYQMLGNDEDWIAAGNDGFARYSNLPFGNYTFQVKAANSDGVWND